MAFSSSSYFAGIGTAFVAVAVGFAGGALVTTSAVQPPNRLERVTSKAPPPPAPPATEQPNVPQASAQPANPTAVPAAEAPTPPAQAQTEPVVRKSESVSGNETAATNIKQPAPTTPPQSAKNEDATPATNERANARSVDPRREARRKRAEDRKFAARRRRQDQDEAANTAPQTRRDDAVGQTIIDRDEPPRFVERRPRFGSLGNDEDSSHPPREAASPFGFFGND